MTGQTAANACAAQRLSEVGAILAAGLQRLLTRQSSPNSLATGESLLHISPVQSVPPETAAEGELG
jgi:hypothetical protein